MKTIKKKRDKKKLLREGEEKKEMAYMQLFESLVQIYYFFLKWSFSLYIFTNNSKHIHYWMLSLLCTNTTPRSLNPWHFHHSYIPSVVLYYFSWKKKLIFFFFISPYTLGKLLVYRFAIFNLEMLKG